MQCSRGTREGINWLVHSDASTCTLRGLPRGLVEGLRASGLLHRSALPLAASPWAAAAMAAAGRAAWADCRALCRPLMVACACSISLRKRTSSAFCWPSLNCSGCCSSGLLPCFGSPFLQSGHL